MPAKFLYYAFTFRLWLGPQVGNLVVSEDLDPVGMEVNHMTCNYKPKLLYPWIIYFS